MWRLAHHRADAHTQSDRTGDPMSDYFRAMSAAADAMDYMGGAVRSAPSGWLTAADGALCSAWGARPGIAPPARGPPSGVAPLTDEAHLP